MHVPRLTPYSREAYMLPIQHWITSTQTPVYFVKTPELPILELKIIFDAGSARDGAYPGTAELTHNILREGTNRFSAEQIAFQFENVGAIFHTSNDQDMATVSLRTLTKQQFLGPALATLSNLLNAPQFSTSGFLHQQKLLLTFLEHQEQSPGDLVLHSFFAALYPHHPYKNPSAGIKKSMLKLTPEQIANFYRQYYCAQNARIVMVGDITLVQAQKITEQLSHQLPQGNLAPKLPTATSTAIAKTEKITYRSAQTHIVMGQVGINHADPNYFPLYVGNHILGGDPSISQLGQSVREQEGLVYDIHSYFLPLAYKGPFLISLQTRSKKAEQALSMVKNTLHAFLAKKLLTAQIKAAKHNIVKGYSLHFDSNAAIAANLVELAFYDLPLDYFDTFTDKISAITAEQVQKAFKKIIKPELLTTIFLGK